MERGSLVKISQLGILEEIMNIRKAALLCAAIGLSVASYGCGDEGNGLFVQCDAGTFRCDGDTMQACAVVNWQNVTVCPMGCDSATGQCKLDVGQECIVSVCKNSTTLNKCSADFKLSEEACGANQECVANACVNKAGQTECSPQQKRCSADNSGVQVCSPTGVWGEVESCGENKVCDASFNCVDNTDAKICDDGVKECVDGSSYRECSGNAWSEAKSCGVDMVCEGAGVCNAKQPEVVCEAGAKKCSDDFKGVQTCADNAWGEAVPCGAEQLCDIDKLECVAAAEAKVCEPGAKECDGDASLKSCNDNGQWDAAVACPEETPVCSGNACVPKEVPGDAKCVAGEKKCDGETKQLVCEGEGADADWKVVECSTVGDGYICDATNECVAPASQVVCQKDEIKCANTRDRVNTYVKCLDDGSAWDTNEIPCDPATPKCDDGITPVACVAACQRNAVRCSADGVRQICSVMTGNWQDQACGEFETCVYDENNKTASCKCTEGATMCGGRNNNQVRTCQADGSWGNYGNCPTKGDICVDNVCVPPCTNGAKRCSDEGKKQTCNNGEWTDDRMNQCNATESCVETNGQISCVCKDGANRCQNGNIQVCMSGEWKKHDSDMICSNAGVIQSCSRMGQLQDIVNCGSAASCYATKDAAGCCKENDPAVCSESKSGVMACAKDNRTGVYNWTETKCENGVCKDDATNGAFCACMEKTYICESETGGDVRKVCKDGKYTADGVDQCSRAQTCSSENGGVCLTRACMGDVSYCSASNVVVKCENQQYVSTTCQGRQVCVEKTDRNGNVAAACQQQLMPETCTNGAMRCSYDSLSIETCQRGGWVAKACAKSEVCALNNDKPACAKKVCTDYEYSCNGDKIMVCDNNELKELADCASVGRTCKENKCVAK